MKDTKPIYQSTTIWGIVLVIVSAINQLFQLKTGNALINEGDLNAIVSSAGTLIGAGIAIYGRVKAVSKIS